MQKGIGPRIKEEGSINVLKGHEVTICRRVLDQGDQGPIFMIRIRI